ncbi:MAG TPA: tetratricopeptide repeat protein [Pirellula sp.]|nr:tetratricopeptide repeat protein [Pirellula sp.]
MPASPRKQQAIGKSSGQQPSNKRASVFFLAVSAFLIACLTVAWLVMRSKVAKPESRHISVLDMEIVGPEFSPNATDNEILASADRQAQTILGAYPNLAAAYNVKANRNYLTGDLEVAKATWSRALELDPNSNDAMLGLAIIALESGDFQRTTELCEQCMLTSPGNPRIPLLLAESHLQDGQANKSILVLSKHIASQPTSVQALELLGTAYLNLRDYEKAITQFKRVLAFSPNSKDAFYGLSQASSKLGRSEEAKNYVARFNEIASNATSSNQRQAQTFQSRAFASNVCAQVYVDSGMIYRRFGERKREEECLLRAQKLQPNDIAWLEELQKSFFETGKLREAADVAERLVQLNAKNVDYWLRLGQLYSDLEMADSAINAFTKAVKLAPNDERCKKAETVLRKLKST